MHETTARSVIARHHVGLRFPAILLIAAVAATVPAAELLSRSAGSADDPVRLDATSRRTVPVGASPADDIEPEIEPAIQTRNVPVADLAPPPEPAAPSLDGGDDGVVSVALIGDSLANEAKAFFVLAFGSLGDRARIDTYTFGGTATCDWLDEIEALAAAGGLDAAVLEFSGNALTPCMQGRDGAPLERAAYLDTYERATRSAIELLRGGGAEIYLAIAPVSRDTSPDSAGEELRDIYRALATEAADVHTIDADAAVLDRGLYADELACLDFEGADLGCVDGTIPVRKISDGAHFCPTDDPAVNGVVGDCATWSSGAFRYGTALADPIVAAIQQAAGV